MSQDDNPEPGSIRMDDVVIGMKYASLAITDDEEGTLAKVGKANPWHIEALKIITGSEHEAHKPLTTILSSHMGLTCDKIIDISGMSPGGDFLDTQGYIAHNDDTIVLAFRCTTSAFDWLTNFTTTSSEWEIEEDVAQGHSGHCSCIEGLCCTGGVYKPRVHTGFYNNFLATVPLLREHLDPLLAPDQPARKLYVVGHSLGAGIATMAACYYVLQFDWTELPHKLVVVTAGSPRACQDSMRDKINEEMAKLKPMDKAVICRIVRDKDVVPKVPPSIFGFYHLNDLVYINDDGEILFSQEDDGSVDENEMKNLLTNEPPAKAVDDASSSDSSDDEDEDKTKRSKYDKMVSRIPAQFRDHMPDFYLKPLLTLFENNPENEDADEPETADVGEEDGEEADGNLEDATGGDEGVEEVVDDTDNASATEENIASEGGVAETMEKDEPSPSPKKSKSRFKCSIFSRKNKKKVDAVVVGEES